MLVPIYKNIAVERCENALWIMNDFNVAMDMLFNPDKYIGFEEV